MTKRDRHLADLRPLVEAADPGAIEAYLLRHSGLPGRRANVELAAAFADLHLGRELTQAEWRTLTGWASMDHEEAPTNSREEFLPFAAVQTLGAAYTAMDGARRDEAFVLMRAAARGERWRTREAAVFALQRTAERDFELFRGMLAGWLERSSLKELRAVAAAVAHPPLLEGSLGPEAVGFALEALGEILRRVERLPVSGRRTEEFRIIAKGMGFAVSVVAAADPERGFRFLGRWAGSEDMDVKKIVSANIRKSRLARRYPEECREVAETLGSG